MCTININNILATKKNLPDAGKVLYDALNNAIKTNSKVVVDMTGVEALPSIFLNMSLGRIIEDFGEEALKGNSLLRILQKHKQNV